MLEVKFSGSPQEVRDQIREFLLGSEVTITSVAVQAPVVETTTVDETPVTQTTTGPTVDETPTPTPEPPETKIIKLRAALAELVSAGHKATDLQKWLKDTFDAEKAVDVAHDRLDEAIEAVKAMSL